MAAPARENRTAQPCLHCGPAEIAHRAAARAHSCAGRMCMRCGAAMSTCCVGRRHQASGPRNAAKYAPAMSSGATLHITHCALGVAHRALSGARNVASNLFAPAPSLAAAVWWRPWGAARRCGSRAICAAARGAGVPGFGELGAGSLPRPRLGPRALARRRRERAPVRSCAAQRRGLCKLRARPANGPSLIEIRRRSGRAVADLAHLVGPLRSPARH